MNETLREYVDSRGVAMRVDRDAAVVRGVKVLGLQSRNGRTYRPESLAGALGLYEGAKVHVNHPKGMPGGPRDYQDRIGAIRDVVYRPGEGLFADFHFNPKHALAEQLLWDAEHAPENVGFSHNVEARTRVEDGRTMVEEILKVQSVDLVADPATTRGLFEAAGPLNTSFAEGLTAEELRRVRPDLVEELLGDVRQETQRLREQLERLQARESRIAKRDAVARLLRQFNLPVPDGDDSQGRVLVDESFLESLYAAPNEETMRGLVAQRARLLRAAASRLDLGGPTSREQNAFRGPMDAEAFVQAIT